MCVNENRYPRIKLYHVQMTSVEAFYSGILAGL